MLLLLLLLRVLFLIRYFVSTYFHMSIELYPASLSHCHSVVAVIRRSCWWCWCCFCCCWWCSMCLCYFCLFLLYFTFAFFFSFHSLLSFLSRALSFSLISSRFVSFVLFPFWIERNFAVLLIQMLNKCVRACAFQLVCLIICLFIGSLSLPLPFTENTSWLWHVFSIFLNTKIIKKEMKRESIVSSKVVFFFESSVWCGCIFGANLFKWNNVIHMLRFEHTQIIWFVYHLWLDVSNSFQLLNVANSNLLFLFLLLLMPISTLIKWRWMCLVLAKNKKKSDGNLWVEGEWQMLNSNSKIIWTCPVVVDNSFVFTQMATVI